MKTWLIMLAAILVMAGPVDAEEPRISPEGHFIVHIDPWLSLHHFAHHMARREASDRMLSRRVSIREADLEAITPAFRAALERSYAAYEPYLDTDLLFTPQTRATARALLQSPEQVEDPALRAALLDMMPHYEASLWPRHQAEALALRDRLMADLARNEAEMAQRLSHYLERGWPDEPIRVDLVAYANWAGAYTDHDPDNITLAVSDPEAGGASAFEMLFHEATHTQQLGSALMPTINQALQAEGLEDRRVWHYALFYITGRITADVHGGEGYVPYAEAAGMFERPGMAAAYSAMAETWEQADSLTGFAQAFSRAMAEQQESGLSPD